MKNFIKLTEKVDLGKTSVAYVDADRIIAMSVKAAGGSIVVIEGLKFPMTVAEEVTDIMYAIASAEPEPQTAPSEN